jgi:gas vesicle protein
MPACNGRNDLPITSQSTSIAFRSNRQYNLVIRIEDKKLTGKGGNNMASDDIIKGFIIGGLIGAGLGILYAPKSGKETREQIRNSAREALETAKTQYEEAYKKIEELTTHNKEVIADKKERLKKALNAGLETFKQETAA